ncbi:hypothetical protein [Nonomuraea cavernae]|uniref:hypothetical protein n=1 Tax=Nonomuraea cavernae TaxID=2045107 RepID=UPI0016637D54|nr:hypothetical protein [Nonomuraea cavernae]MCA2184298.1 hypothetical protein [Nonomuraea cavernae]
MSLYYCAGGIDTIEEDLQRAQIFAMVGIGLMVGGAACASAERRSAVALPPPQPPFPYHQAPQNYPNPPYPPA